MMAGLPDGHLLAASAAVVPVAYAASYAWARRLIGPGSACPWELADVLFHAPYVPLLLYLVCKGLADLAPRGVEGRWHEHTPETRLFLALYLVHCTLHVGVLALKRHVSSPAMYVAHHALSLACYGMAFATRRMHFWAVLDALCEVTNIFLNNIFLFRSLGWDKRYDAVYKVNGALLWVSYVAFRLCLFPYWLWLFARDAHAAPERTWDAVNPFERYAYAGTTALLLAISLVWFGKITAGLVNAIRPDTFGGGDAPPADGGEGSLNADRRATGSDGSLSAAKAKAA